jgi:hypothetical protein
MLDWPEKSEVFDPSFRYNKFVASWNGRRHSSILAKEKSKEGRKLGRYKE